MMGLLWASIIAIGGFLILRGPSLSVRDRAIARHVSDVAASAANEPRNAGVIGAASTSVRALVRGCRRGVVAQLRRRSISAARDELPVFLDFAVLCVTAGMGVVDTFSRLSRMGDGVLARECRYIVSSHELGVPLAAAFEASTIRVPLDAWARSLAVLREATERGTPLATAISSVACEEREAAGRRLIESGSAREVAMLIPLVFVILPVTVIFAVYPGLTALSIGV